jgi:hypothetical protein
MTSPLKPGVTNPLASIFSYNNPPTQLSAPTQLSSLANYGSFNPNLMSGFSYNMADHLPQASLSAMSNGSVPGFDISLDTFKNIGNYGQDSGFGINMPTFELGLQGLMGLGNLYFANEANGLAKKSFALTKKTAEDNYRNTVQSYNTALEDQRNVRGFMEGKSQAQIQSEIERNRLA